MAEHTVALIAGFVAALLTFVMVMPQTLKIWRDNSAVGVSLLTWSMFLCTYAMWFGYSIRTGNVTSTVSNIFTDLLLGLLVLGILRVERRAGTIRIGAAVYACAALFFLIGMLSPLAVVFALMLLATLMRLPQIIKSFHTMVNRTPSEVSFPTWWIGIGASVAWTVHGLLLPDMIFVVTSLIAIVFAILVLIPEYIARARRARLAA